MTIKQLGGVFGRNPTFNDVTIEGQLTFDGDIDVNSDLKVDGNLDVTGTGDFGGKVKVTTAGNGEIEIERTSGALINLQAQSARGVIGTNSNHELQLKSNNTGRLKITTSGNVEVMSGNLVIGTSGKGIDFSATAGPNPPASGTSELLSDYEEGTWTATLTGSTAAPTTPITTTGTYTKFGRAVTVTCSFNAVSLSGSTGTVEITGLPFLVGSQDCHGTCGNNGLSGGSLMCTAVSGLTLLSVRSLDTTVFTPTVAGTVYVLASITYFV
jgi:hypothetical protein